MGAPTWPPIPPTFGSRRRSRRAPRITCSAVNGLAIAGIAYLWKGQFLLSVILGVALLFNMLVAAVVGTLVPITLKMFRIDPTIASSVIITTFTDVFGFFSFLGLGNAADQVPVLARQSHLATGPRTA